MKQKIKVRKCYRCNSTFDYESYITSNLILKDLYTYSKHSTLKVIHKHKEYLKKIWNSKYIQLYCCTCYKNIIDLKIFNEMIEIGKLFF